MSAGNANRYLGHDLPFEFVDNAGFSDARLASNKNDLPFVIQGVLKIAPQLIEHSISSDQLSLRALLRRGVEG
jgi:hypothetical protein